MSASPRFRRLSRMVGDRAGQAMGDEAVRAGLLTPDQLRTCERTAAEHPDRPFRQVLQDVAGLPAQALDLLEMWERGRGVSRRLGDRYELQGELGRGAVGIVYKAWDIELKRHVAVKFLRADRTLEANAIQRVRHEATAVGRLKHPHLPVLHDVGTEGGRPYLVMELVEGPTLADEVASGSLTAVKSAEIIEKSARAIHSAHEQRIVHRDLKPGNIKLDARGEPKILDFGLVQLFGGEEGLTRTGAALGTPLYMAPEQVRGQGDRIDARTDVYGLGATLYEMATGRPPFTSDAPHALFEKILSQEPVPPRRVRPDVPLELQVVILKAMEKEPGRRYPTALEMAEDLRRFLRGEPVCAVPPSSWSRWRRRVSRAPVVATALGAVLVLLIATGLIWRWGRERSFDTERTAAQAAYDRRDWEGALTHAVRALSVRESPQLVSMARDCRLHLATERLERERGVRHRNLLERLRPFEDLIRKAADYRYVSGGEFVEMRGELERRLEDLAPLASDPAISEFPELWTVLGSGWFIVGDERKAEHHLLEANRRGATSSWVPYSLGRIYLARAQTNPVSDQEFEGSGRRHDPFEATRLATEWFARLTGAGPSDLDLHLVQAYRAAASDAREETLRLCDEGLARFGTRTGTEEYWILRGWMKERNEQATEAVDCFTNAINRCPQHALAFYSRGWTRIRSWTIKDTHPDAQADFGEALRINPRMVDAMSARALVRFCNADWEGALADCRAAIVLDPSYVTPRHLGIRLLLNLNRPAEALEVANEWIGLGRQAIDAHWMRAQVHDSMGRQREAIADLRSAIAAAEGMGWVQLEAARRKLAELDR